WYGHDRGERGPITHPSDARATRTSLANDHNHIHDHNTDDIHNTHDDHTDHGITRTDIASRAALISTPDNQWAGGGESLRRSRLVQCVGTVPVLRGDAPLPLLRVLRLL